MTETTLHVRFTRPTRAWTTGNTPVYECAVTLPHPFEHIDLVGWRIFDYLDKDRQGNERRTQIVTAPSTGSGKAPRRPMLEPRTSIDADGDLHTSRHGVPCIEAIRQGILETYLGLEQPGGGALDGQRLPVDVKLPV